jgi:hypothetical protein
VSLDSLQGVHDPQLPLVEIDVAPPETKCFATSQPDAKRDAIQRLKAVARDGGEERGRLIWRQ